MVVQQCVSLPMQFIVMVFEFFVPKLTGFQNLGNSTSKIVENH
jgi:hypothetical protein